MRKNSSRFLAAAAVLALSATSLGAAEPDFFEQLSAGRQAIAAMALAQAAAAANVSGQGAVSSENVAVTQNPGSYWYYAYVPVSGDVTLDGPNGVHGTVHLTGLIYVSGSGWGGTGRARARGR